MNNLAGAVLLCLTLLAPMVIYGAYLVLRHFKAGRTIGLGLGVACMIVLGLMVAQTMAGGALVQGVVVAKSEQVQLARRQVIPSVLHILRAEVRVGGSPGQVGADTLILPLSPGPFDRLRVGSPVQLRQTRFGPLRLARLADAPGWAQLPGLEFTGVLNVLAGAANLLALGFGVLTPLMGWRGRAAFVAVAVLAGSMDVIATRSWWASRPQQETATVVEVRTVSQALLPSRLFRHYTEVFRLPRPYDEVTLRLLPGPGADPVTAIDRVDSGSAGSLAAGEIVPVAFDAEDPRDARLKAGTRAYALAAYAARFGARAALGALAALALFGAMVYLGRRRALQSKAAVGPMT
jgi:hypothetical protein